MNSKADTQLHGYKLILARTAWAIIVAMALSLWLADIPLGYTQYLTVCTLSSCPNQLATPDMVQALHSAGLSLQFYALYLTTIEIVFVLILCTIGIIIAWRKSRDWMALLVSLTLVIIGTVITTDYQQLASAYPITQLPGDLLQYLLFTLPFLVGLLFPSGHFVPRWTRWLALMVILLPAGGIFLPNSPFNTHNLPGPLNIVLALAAFGTVIFAQVYRYFRVSTPIQRQQTKWVILGIIATMIFFIALGILTTLDPDYTQVRSLGFLLAGVSYFLALLIIPLAISFSILRYHLWDIDLLINRTLVIVASTLTIAALFHPLRRRIQKIIDKRFYRRKYDTARVLADFSSTLRSEMDLSQLREQLVEVVQETMQPAHVSLWLRKPEQERKHSTK